MEYAKLNENTVKIIISAEELKSMNVNFNELCNNNVKTSIFFKALCDNLEDSFVKNAFVEVFNLDEQGIVIYVSKIPPKISDKKTDITVTFENEKPEKLCELCFKLKSLANDCSGTLYSDGKNYRLVIKIPPENTEGIRKLVNKYKIYAKIGEIVPSLTSEHNELWKVIIPDNAVNILSEGF
ncbi:MAG: adaptor protein MecA [Oscillospiraceae bacterium]|nr:adaptor protein MecA [Oscillospiraceae bacterium]